MPNSYKVLGYDSTNIKQRILGSSDELSVPGDLLVAGNLTVVGATSTVNSEVNLADRFLALNANYSADTALACGIVFNVNPTNAAQTGNINFASGTTIQISGDITSSFGANKIILIRDAEDGPNNGLYEVHSSAHSSGTTTITIKDAVTNQPSASVSGIVNTGLITNSDDDSCVIVPVKIAVMRTDEGNNTMEFAISDSASSLTYKDFKLEGDSTAADDITVGDAAVTISTSSGDVTVNAPTGQSIDLKINSTKVVEVSGTEVDVAQSLHVTDTTAATSASTGALKVDGGASVALDLYIGDDLFLKSDSAVLSLGADNDATFTHDGTAGLTIAASPISIDSTGALHLSSTTGDIALQDGGVDQIVFDLDGSDGEVIMKIGVDSDDFVFQQYDGTEVFRVEDNGDFDVAGGLGSSGVTISAAGAISADGRIITDDTSNATTTTDGSIQTDGGLSVVLDAVIGDDLKLLSDAAVLSFGADSDVSLTHVADTGLLLNAGMALRFRDAALSIKSSADGQLDIDADTTLQITAPTVDIDASSEVNISGAMKVGGNLTPNAADGSSLGTAALEWSDLYLADGAKIEFGNDQDVKLAHIADTGLRLGDARSLQFRDANASISSPAASHLGLTAATAIELDGFARNKKGAGLKLTAAGSIAIGEVLYITSAGAVDQADMDGSEFTKRVVGIAMGTANDGDDVLVNTFFGTQVDVKFAAAPASSNLGKPVYLSDNGLVSLTAPTGSGDNIVQIGILTEDGDSSETLRKILFQPVYIAQVA